MMMSELTEDLLEEIFCRVRASSLKRLRYTCKRWNRLFKDKRFTGNHLEKAPKQFMVLMLKKSMICLTRINHRRFQPVMLKGELNLIDPNSSCLDRQTRWINGYEESRYALGSYQDKKSNDNSYKILCRMVYGPPSLDKHKFKIYEIKSDSWRTLDVTLDFKFDLGSLDWGVSLKGNTYWIAEDEKGKLLASFDYTRERFERLCPLPRQYRSYRNLALSIVRDEKLSVLLQRDVTYKTEIWVTNKIGETEVVSWSMVMDLDSYSIAWDAGSFFVDEEKKVLVCCDISAKVYIVEENNKARPVDYGALFNYIPSLTQIQQDIGGKRKRGFFDFS